MNKLLCTAAVLSILMLSGCASQCPTIQPIMEPRQSPAMSSSYVAGMFSQEWESGKTSFGLGIVNTATAEEYVIPFGTKRILPKQRGRRNCHDSASSGRIQDCVLAQLFDQRNGTNYSNQYLCRFHERLAVYACARKVVFIGSYVARKERSSRFRGRQTRVRHQRLTLQSAQKSLSNSYPAFATQAMSCPSCLK